jgi:hypothetical protein
VNPQTDHMTGTNGIEIPPANCHPGYRQDPTGMSCSDPVVLRLKS